MKRRPSSQALLTAAEWLDCNESEDDEELECKAVAEWLREVVQKANEESVIREHARKHNVTPALIRAALRKARK